MKIKEGTKIIKYGAFDGNDTLEEIVIPNSVIRIEGSAFRNCTSLKKVVLPVGLKELPQSIFEGCRSLLEITLPDSVTIIRNHAFAGCKALKTIELPEGIFVVEPHAFEKAACEGRVTYKGSLKRLHANTLFTKSDHQMHIEIPEGVVWLDERAFAGYTDLEAITFPKTLKQIGSYCFEGCTNLKEVHFHEGMEIGWYSFKDCVSLSAIELPEKCKVGELAFWYCKNLTSVRLPHVAQIDWSAFYDCLALEKIYAPEDADYRQLYKRLPNTCHILNLDGKEVFTMTINMQEWDGEIPKESLLEIEKLQGKSLEEQLHHCYIVTTEEEESVSYGESECNRTYKSRNLLKKDKDFDILLVQKGMIVGFINMKKNNIFLGQMCRAYSSVDTDGTGSTYFSSVSHLRVMDL